MPDISWPSNAGVGADSAVGRQRIAVVLFNLGGPDSLEAVRPFLVNLFTDPAILRVPAVVRPFLSRLIAWLRVKPATENYRLMGGRSPLLELTSEQASALERALSPLEVKCFIAMRYWKPFSLETAQAVKSWNPDHIVLLPLYPQFSTTTTGSSLAEWFKVVEKIKLSAPTTTVCCYPTHEPFIRATASILSKHYASALADLRKREPGTTLRVLFSAHGLPQVIVDQGDPYRYQVEQTAALVANAAHLENVEWRVCFQSRATPQKWLEPSIEAELVKAAEDKVAVIVLPIAFVSEHSETLVELDIEYREMAEKIGLRGYYRVPTQNSDVGFINGLASLVLRSVSSSVTPCSHTGGRVCPVDFKDCPVKQALQSQDPVDGSREVNLQSHEVAAEPVS